MLRSIFEGYAPVAIIAMIAASAIGGSTLAWVAFVWVFGALATVFFAYLRSRIESTEMRPQPLSRMENC